MTVNVKAFFQATNPGKALFQDNIVGKFAACLRPLPQPLSCKERGDIPPFPCREGGRGVTSFHAL